VQWSVGEVKCSAVLHVLGILDLDLDLGRGGEGLGWAGMGWDGMVFACFGRFVRSLTHYFPLPSSLFPLLLSLLPPAYPDFTLLYRYLYPYLGN